tara:strand:- start:457 stop:795 length:339 start_codon:yes stop_codon:yes gene_type:complete
MAFTPYHNIVGSTAQSVELIGLNDTAKASIKSIQITNISLSAAATVDLFLYKDSTDTTAEEYYYFLRKYQISYRDYLILDNIHLLNFDNSSTGYSLHIEVGSADTVDVMIRI